MAGLGTSVAGTIEFKELAALCETIARMSNKDKKKDILRRFMESWRKKYNLIYPGNPQPAPETMFPVMRLLMPEADKERPVYGIKEHSLAKLYIDELGLAASGEGAQNLLHWKKNKPRNATSAAEVSDFGGVAFFVLMNRLAKQGEMTIKEVNDQLDLIAEGNLIGGDERKEAVKGALQFMLRKTDAVEQKWLIRIILKDLKFGMSEDTIMNVFHPDAKDLFDVTSSLSTVCTRLHDPSVRLSEIEVSLFAPVRPMLAETWNPDKLRTVLKGGTALTAEVKYDGDRCQIHKKGKEFRYFSRAGNDNTDILGRTATEGTLTKYIADCLRRDLTSFILDGEICAYNIEAKCIATKAESMTIKSLTGENGFQTCFVAFDVLLINDKTVTALPLRQRLDILKDMFQEEEGRLYYSLRTEVSTPEQCYDYLNQAIDRNEEGIMLKDPSTVYKPNARSAGWWKVKPEFVDSLSDQLDVALVGAYYGTGRRSGPSHFMLAVAQEPTSKPDDKPSKFLSFCRVGSGYTYKELEEMGTKLSPHFKKWTKTSRPDFLQLAPGDKEKPDLWVEPWNSFVVKVSAAQIVDSDQFATGCTLRFPRMKEPRYDKPWYECMTFNQLNALRTETGGRLGGRNITDEHVGDGSPKKRGRVTNRTAIVRLAEQFRPADVTKAPSEGGIFSGKTFCVAGGDAQYSKQDMEKLVLENGGSCVQNPDVATFCVVSDKLTVHVKNLVKQLNLDVVHPSWIHKCLEEKRVIPWQSQDMLSAKPATEKLMHSVFDKYGDSFTDRVVPADVDEFFAEMEGNVDILDHDQLAEFEDRYWNQSDIPNIFRLVRAYIDKFEAVAEDEAGSSAGTIMRQLAEELVVGCGGNLCEELDSVATHAVVDPFPDSGRLERIQTANRKRKKKLHVVTNRWVIDSVEKNALLEERGFLPRDTLHLNANIPCVKSVFEEFTDTD